jgi:hypothetical protein
MPSACPKCGTPGAESLTHVCVVPDRPAAGAPACPDCGLSGRFRPSRLRPPLWHCDGCARDFPPPSAAGAPTTEPTSEAR